ncbi:MAG: hypothetical protein NTV22_00345 [bacterium]|jgi:hypothetical protein|nr:hypothetical protein [bacterium]
MNTRFPIYVLAKDCGEIAQFQNVYELQSTLEAIDIDNNEYAAWDSDGRPLCLRTQMPVWLDVRALSDMTDSSGLRDAFQKFAKSLSLPDSLVLWRDEPIEDIYHKVIRALPHSGMRKKRISISARFPWIRFC